MTEREEAIVRAAKVKPLVWEETQADRGDGTHEHDGGYEAECSFGVYTIDFNYFNETWAAFGTDSGCLAVPSGDPWSAKAAAQADYEARILSALETIDPHAIVRAALERAADEVPHWHSCDGGCVRHLAHDPEAVAEIIAAAKENKQ